MPSAKTECTELSVGFGLLQCDPFQTSPEKAVKLWGGTLDQAGFSKYVSEFRSNEGYYKKFYNIGVNLACSHKILASSKITVATWEGPRQQARTVSLPKDIVVANVPISVKADSNVVANPSPHHLFVCIPQGISHKTKGESWYLLTGGDSYQKLYSFVRDTCCLDFPASVLEYHKKIKGEKRKVLSEAIENLSGDDQKEFYRLYVTFCHTVAEESANRFNKALAQLERSMKNSVYESILRLFFRLSDSSYVLCGLANGKGFSIDVPDLSTWKRDWILRRVTAVPDLSRDQSVVDFKLVIENRGDRNETGLGFHSEIRWSHRKFKGNPEAKLYKEFKWTDLIFVEKIGSTQVRKIELIGTGGFGHVYRAILEYSGEIVALKELLVQCGENERLRFEREVRLQQQLDHPNILPIILSDLSDENPWFVSPLARCNLADILHELPGNVVRINRIFMQLLYGLEYAHQAKVIHRDIKPENILVFENDHVKLGDFGLGKKIDTDSVGTALTQSSENAFGTLAYAAPEQLESFKDADGRADIFSLGKTLFHMVTGRPPSPFSELQIEIVDSRYREFINICTQKNPKDRFQTIQDALTFFNNFPMNY